MTDRLFQPGNAFRLERASPTDSLGDGQRLVVVDRQLYCVGQPLSDCPGDGKVLLEGRMAEPQFYASKPSSEQLFGLVRGGLRRHQPQAARIVSGDGPGLGPSNVARGRPAATASVPYRRVER